MSISLLFLLLWMTVSAQYCGRYSSTCTNYLTMGQREIWKVGIEGDTVASLRREHRYYSTNDCSNTPVVTITTVYDVKKNTTKTDYTNEYLFHSANVSDYLILSSNVNYLSMLGITCSPSLQNNVEVSLKLTICESSLGILEGEDYIGSRAFFYIRFPSISSFRISTIYPLIEPTTFERVDNEGCIGCKSYSVWKGIDVGQSQKTFCSSQESGYISQSCVIGPTGNGMWSGQSVSECSEIEKEVKLENGEGYFRGVIIVNIEPSLFTASEHEYMMNLLRQQVVGNDLSTRAFTPESVKNVDSLSSTGDPSQPVEVNFRVTGEISKVKKALSSISNAMNTGALHKKMIIHDQMYFDVTMSFDDNIKITSNSSTTTIAIVCGVVIVVLLVVIILLVLMLLKKSKPKKVDIESGSEYSDYSDSYYDYSDYSDVDV